MKSVTLTALLLVASLVSTGIAQTTNGLVAYWPMDETSGNNVADAIGGNSGIAYNSQIITGAINNGRSCAPNTTSYGIVVPNSQSLNIHGTGSAAAFTCAAFIKQDVYEGAGLQIIHKDGQYELGLGSYGSTGQLQLQLFSNTNPTRVYMSSGQIPLGRWVSLAATWDGANASLYIDGQLVNSLLYIDGVPALPGSVPWTIPSGSANVRLGDHYGADQPISTNVTGIDEVRMYNRALSAAEVAALYNSEVTTVAFDIKPGSCPNPVNVKSGTQMEVAIDSNAVQIGKLAPARSGTSKEVLPVAILGTSEFDVSSVDIGSVRLLGIAPIRSAFEDVGTPLSPGAEECACNSYGPDGYLDLTLKFYRDDIAVALGAISVGETRRLTLTGKLKDGSNFEGYDCIVVVGNPNAAELPLTGNSSIALANYPNPFNPVTTISFAMPQAGHAKLDIYNTLGQLVATLVDEKLEAGVHAITWDASSQASGLYLYRLTTSDVTETKKMLMLK